MNIRITMLVTLVYNTTLHTILLDLGLRAFDSVFSLIWFFYNLNEHRFPQSFQHNFNLLKFKEFKLNCHNILEKTTSSSNDLIYYISSSNFVLMLKKNVLISYGSTLSSYLQDTILVDPLSGPNLENENSLIKIHCILFKYPHYSTLFTFKRSK